MQVEPYLSLNGRCDEAIAFYRNALGAEVQMLMRFKDSPQCAMITPGTEEKVMHAALRIGKSNVMMSDGRCTGTTKFEGISLSLAVETDEQAQRAFTALSEGGNVCMPLQKTFFSSQFGMVTDRFGVMWMILAGH